LLFILCLQMKLFNFIVECFVECCTEPETLPDLDLANVQPARVCERDDLSNGAFVFIEPQANTEQVRRYVREKLIASGSHIVDEGFKNAPEIDEKCLYDKHHFSIASSATLSKLEDLYVPADRFEKKFGLSWDEAKSKELVFTASDACAKLKVDGDGLAKLWQVAVDDGRVIKFGHDFHCGKIKPAEGEPLYVFNGYFMSMREAFTSPGQQMYYFSVTLPTASEVSSWYLFRHVVVGERDPKDANPETIRNHLLGAWEELGLKCEPDKLHNGVHASASPFEGLAERCNWLGVDLEQDSFGKSLLDAGISRKWIEEGFKNPEVKKQGETSRLFQELEDKDPQDCIETLLELHEVSVPSAGMNEALILLEPHTATKKHVSCVRETLRNAGFNVVAEGVIPPCKETPKDSDLLSVITATTASTRATGSSASSRFSAPGSRHYFCVKWSAKLMPWETFQADFVGSAEDPADAPPTSLRGFLYTQWREVDLKRQPGAHNIGIHASASPLEGLADRLRWLGSDVEDDPFGKVLADRGIKLDWVMNNLENKQILDLVRNMNTDECVRRLEQLPLERTSPTKVPDCDAR